jgi:hypothetical protein
MKRISKNDHARIDDLVLRLSRAADTVDEAIAAVQSALIEANAIRGELYNVLDDLCVEAEAYYNDRSDKWREGDAGDAYQSWIYQLEATRDAVDDDFSVEIENPVLEAVTGVENNMQGEPE